MRAATTPWISALGVVVTDEERNGKGPSGSLRQQLRAFPPASTLSSLTVVRWEEEEEGSGVHAEDAPYMQHLLPSFLHEGRARLANLAMLKLDWRMVSEGVCGGGRPVWYGVCVGRCVRQALGIGDLAAMACPGPVLQ